MTDLSSELEYQFSRSGGKGGQNVNKVETKVQLRFHVQNSEFLSEEQKQLIIQNLANKINKEGELVLSNQQSRSQLDNKQAVTKQFYQLISQSLQKKKKRKKSNIPASVKRKRLADKKRLANKKKQRNRDSWGE